MMRPYPAQQSSARLRVALCSQNTYASSNASGTRPCKTRLGRKRSTATPPAGRLHVRLISSSKLRFISPSRPPKRLPPWWRRPRACAVLKPPTSGGSQRSERRESVVKTSVRANRRPKSTSANDSIQRYEGSEDAVDDNDDADCDDQTNSW